MSENNILGVILAGGKSKRFGNDKTIAKLGNKTLLDHTIEKIEKNFNEILIVSNSEKIDIKKKNIFSTKDLIEGYLGPLVGVLSAMVWIEKNKKKYNWIATFPCDTPFFPETVIQKFIEKSKEKDSLLLCASSHGRKHNIFGLWSIELYEKLHDDLINNKIRKVQDWIEKNKITNVEFNFKEYDPFFNINTLDDLEAAKKIIKNEKK